jgi:hypothetical protein
VNELADLVQAKLLGALPKDKEHGVDDIRLSTSVRTYDAGEAFVKGTDLLETSVAFEVFKSLVSETNEDKR